MFRMIFEQLFKGQHPLGQAFCVVQAVNTEDALLLVLRHKCVGHFFGHVLKPFKRNADGQISDTNCSTSMFSQKCLAINAATKAALAAVDEIQAVVLDVETHEVAAKDALEDHVKPGEDLDNVPWREWNVQEEADLAAQVFFIGNLKIHLILDISDLSIPETFYLANRVGCQHKVVVVYPQQRDLIWVLGQRLPEGIQCACGKGVVDLLVSGPKVFAENCSIWHRMKKGPKCGIATAIVVKLKKQKEWTWTLDYYQY